MKMLLSTFSILSGILTAVIGAFLFAACQRGDSELIGKLGFAFILFAPTAGMAVTLWLQVKIAAGWLAASLGLLVAIVTLCSNGFIADLITWSLAAKQTTRDFWAIYWVGGFALTAIYVLQGGRRSLTRLALAELLQRPSSH